MQFDLVTDQCYLTWVFKCDGGRWDQHDATSNIEDYIYIINNSSVGGLEIESAPFESNSFSVGGW